MQKAYADSVLCPGTFRLQADCRRCQGNPQIPTPNIDSIAAAGIRFTDGYVTAAYCSPSRAGWNTGLYQARWDPESGWSPGCPSHIPNIAEIMKANGFATARFGKNDYGNKSIHRQDVREYPLNHGYDEFLGFSAHGHDYFLLSKDIEDRTPDPKGHSAVVGPLMHNKGVKEFKDAGRLKNMMAISPSISSKIFL